MPNGTAGAFPYVSFRFRIEFDSVIAGGFTECSGLQVETEVEEHREGGLNEFSHKLPKGTKYGTITLKRGFIDTTDLWDWNQKVIAGQTRQRKNLSIILLDSEGNDKIRWDVREALPVKWSSSEFKSDGNTVMVESLELVHHGFVRAA
jgi:phage tail-like protein